MTSKVALALASALVVACQSFDSASTGGPPGTCTTSRHI